MKYTKEIMQEAVNGSYSIADVCKKLNLKPRGSNYYTVKNNCKKFGIDISHFVGSDWHKNPNNDKYMIKIDNILQADTNYKPSSLKNRLIELGLKEDKCEICGTSSIWMDKPITLELHHINSDHFDNRIENLQILCPNCHSQQKNHRKPKINHKKDITLFYKHRQELKQCICMNCNKEFQSDRLDRTRKFCSIKCYREYISNNKVKGISTHSAFSLQDLQSAMQSCSTITELARKLNSHRCTVREHLVRNNLYDIFMNKNKKV